MLGLVAGHLLGCQADPGRAPPETGSLSGNATSEDGSPQTDPDASPAADPVDRYVASMATGVTENALGRHQAAERAFTQAYEICNQVHGTDHPDCADSLIRIAAEVSSQGRFEEAGLILDRVEPLAVRAASPLVAPRFWTYRAMVLADRGDFENALTAARRGNAERRDALAVVASNARGRGIPARRVLAPGFADMAHGLFVEAVMAYRLSDLARARLLADLARRMADKSDPGFEWWLGSIDELIALIDAREGDTEQAALRLRQGIVAKRVELGETRPVGLTYLTLGRVLHSLGDSETAVTSMRRGIEIVRGEPENRALPMHRVEPFLVAARAEIGRAPERRRELQSEMFEVVQLAREGVTAKTVARMVARLSTGDPDLAALIRAAEETVEARDTTRLALGREAAKPAEQQDPERRRALRERYRALDVEAVALGARVETAFPGYARLVSSRPVTVTEVTALLAPGEAIILFAVGDVSSTAFLLRQDGLSVSALNINRQEVAEAVTGLRGAFGAMGAGLRKFDMARSFKLHQALLEPFADQLADIDHLMVIPAGALLSLPFALLVRDLPASGGAEDYANAGWLIRDMALSTLPSARAFVGLRQVARRSAARKTLLAFGAPAFLGGNAGLAGLTDHCREDGPIPASLIRGLAPLDDTDREVRAVAAAVGPEGVDFHLGPAANERQVRQTALADYRILYFATHGLLPNELRCQSEPGLALSPPRGEASDRENDGLLDAGEIASLRLDADLVVLSACNTGGGGSSSELGGEALSGLVRSFFHAGARSLIVSHWHVDSAATADLMIGLFRRSGAGPESSVRGGTAEALRQAQNDLLSRPGTGHPFYWAAFTLVGDSGGWNSQTRIQSANGLN